MATHAEWAEWENTSESPHDPAPPPRLSSFYSVCLFSSSLRSFRLPPLFLLFFPVIFYLFLFPPLLLFLSLLLQQNSPSSSSSSPRSSLPLFILLFFSPSSLLSQLPPFPSRLLLLLLLPTLSNLFIPSIAVQLILSWLPLSILSSDISSTFTPFSLISFSSYFPPPFPFHLFIFSCSHFPYFFLALCLNLCFFSFPPRCFFFVLIFKFSFFFLSSSFFSYRCSHFLCSCSHSFCYYFSILTLKLSVFPFFIISVAPAQSPFVPCSFLMHLYNSSSLHHPPPLLWLFFLSLTHCSSFCLLVLFIFFFLLQSSSCSSSRGLLFSSLSSPFFLLLLFQFFLHFIHAEIV